MSYEELPILEDTGERHAWNAFGGNDEFGSLNRLGAQQVIDAARLVQTGDVIRLDLPLDVPGTVSEERGRYVHKVDVSRIGRDDWLDNFYLQGSSQWDGLRHIRFRQFGYYGGRQEEDLDATGVLGIDRVAERGVVGRAVLVDFAGDADDRGLDWSPDERVEISVEDLERLLLRQGTGLRKGDILLVRTGWLDWYLGLEGDEQEAAGTAETMSSVGLAPTREMAAWLWDNGVSAVAADNVALEALPISREQGFLHHRILVLLGMLIGELWNLTPLAEHCMQDGRYEGMLVSAPLKLPNGVGSPSNAYVIK